MEVQLYLHEVLNCNLCRCVQLTFCDTPVTVFAETAAAAVQGFFHVSFICFGQSASRQLARQTGRQFYIQQKQFLNFWWSLHYPSRTSFLRLFDQARLDSVLLCQEEFRLATEGKEDVVMVETQGTSTVGALL